MMGRRKKQPPVQRTPHIERQKQSSFQYSSNRSQSDRTARERGKEDQAKTGLSTYLRKTGFILSGVIFVILAAYASVLNADPKIVIANKVPPLRGSYQKDAAEIAGKSFSSRSKLTLNRQKLTDELHAKYPEMAVIDVTTPIFARRAVIKVVLATPAVVLNSGQDSYLLDSHGVALFDAATGDTTVKKDSLLQISDQTETPVQPGKPALTSSQVAFVTELKQQSEAKKLPVSSFTLTAGGGELNVKHGGLSYLVKYSLYEDARKSFGTFVAAKEYADKSKLKPAEYIDVRIPERAYIR